MCFDWIKELHVQTIKKEVLEDICVVIWVLWWFMNDSMFNVSPPVKVDVLIM